MVFWLCDVERSCVPSKHLGHCLPVLPVSAKVTLGSLLLAVSPQLLELTDKSLIQIRSHRATGLFLQLQSVGFMCSP